MPEPKKLIFGWLDLKAFTTACFPDLAAFFLAAFVLALSFLPLVFKS
jgi:hypothetical protein